MSVSTDKVQEETDYLKQSRGGADKPFSYSNGALAGKSQ